MPSSSFEEIVEDLSSRELAWFSSIPLFSLPEITEFLISILDIPAEIDIVDVFRPPEFVMPVAEDAVKVGARVFWLQQGIINYEAAELVLTAGTTVVMDSCIMVEHQSMKLSS